MRCRWQVKYVEIQRGITPLKINNSFKYYLVHLLIIAYQLTNFQVPGINMLRYFADKPKVEQLLYFSLLLTEIQVHI